MYIGSSTNLGIRLKDYFNFSYISNPKRSNSNIHKALIKYGYSNFKLEIIEYCETDNCIKKEQFYIELLQPEYNILKIAGSSKGYKHTKENLDKIKKHLNKYNTKRKLPVEITNIYTKIVTKYESIVATAAALNTNEKKCKICRKN
jgi:GIY-YIG catalytic domain